MNLKERIAAFSKLGLKIQNIAPEHFEEYASRARAHNQWFTADNISAAFQGLSTMLETEKLNQWLENYSMEEPEIPRIVGIVMAGNIPMVGFHDLLCVLLSGHFAAVKISDKDQFLGQMIIDWLLEIEPRFNKNLEVRDRLTAIDAVIATGSDNTARYFEYYFRNIPAIIRKNRTSVALLTGTESTADLANLGKDIFSYFGQGCRNVSKLLVPRGYEPKTFFESIESFDGIFDHFKYKNNYDYYKSIFLINQTTHLDNGFLLWVPSEELVSPISVLYVQEFDNQEAIDQYLEQEAAKIQCVVGKDFIPFGMAQSPEVWDYADNVDTLSFLIGLK